MRDAIFTIIMAGLVPVILSRPYMGAYAWAWISLMNPHRLLWGFATSIPFGQIVAVVDTTKAAIDVEIWQEGTILELIAKPGDKLPVGALMALLLEPGEEAGTAPAAAARRAWEARWDRTSWPRRPRRLQPRPRSV